MEEKKVVVAYTVKRFEDGSVAVEDAKLEGTTEVVDEQIYKDIEDVADMVNMRRIENAAYAGARRFYADLAASQQKAEEAEAEAPKAE